MFFLIWTLFIVVAVWFFLYRPQKRRMQEHQQLMASLEVGHEIVSAGGIHGTIADVGDDVLHVEVAPGTVIRLARRAVARNVSAEQEARLRAELDDADFDAGDEGEE